ncbi:hypothetical protein J4211_04350 [Candidatus Woesearchaeota archaeon]|nr:hypothetical protein [Candidatus Woesearchaeota archaeon]
MNTDERSNKPENTDIAHKLAKIAPRSKIIDMCAARDLIYNGSWTSLIHSYSTVPLYLSQEEFRREQKEAIALRDFQEKHGDPIVYLLPSKFARSA